jgi:acyl-CoA synthetase (NDP forming)
METTMTKQLEEIFYPRSIAVVGASDNPKKMSYLTVAGFIDMGFKGEIYPINRNDTRSIEGKRAFKNVGEIPGPVDLVVISVPPPLVPSIIKDCADKQVKGIINFSAPADELTPEEEEAIRYAVSRGTRIVGPNSMGLYCPYSGLALFPGMSKEKGKVSFVSHSGAMGWTFATFAGSRTIACNKVITVGNEWDLSWLDFLEHLGADPKTEIIGGYLEGLKDGRRFLEIAREISSRKPVILIKGGSSEVGSDAVVSHTGSVAGEKERWKSVLDQAGVIRVGGLNDLMDHVVAFRLLKDRSIGNRLGIVSGTAGPTVIAADLCEELNLEIPELPASTKDRIREFLPDYGSSDRNPVDVSIAGASNMRLYLQAITALDDCEEIDIIYFIQSGEWQGDELATYLIKGTSGKLKKPFIVSLIGPPERYPQAVLNLLEADIPAFFTIEGPLKALRSLHRWTGRVKREGP